MRTPEAFARLPHGPGEEFRLRFAGALLLLRELAGDPGAVPPSYLDELRGAGDRRAWEADLARWVAAAPSPLPGERLRLAAALEPDDLAVLFLCGLAVEDPRLGRPTAAWIAAGLDDVAGRARTRAAVTRLLDAGLVTADATDGALRVDGPVWSALRGDPLACATAADDLPDLDALVLPPATRHRALAAAGAVACGARGALVVRGPAHSGRRTLLRALARRLGRGAVEVPESAGWSPARVRSVAAVLDALPIVDGGPSPEEAGLVGVRLAPGAAVDGPVAATVDLGMPGPAERLAHWAAALPGHDPAALCAVAHAHRLRGGAIRGVARLALTDARAAGRTAIAPGDVTSALRALRPDPFGELAATVAARGGWGDLVVPPSVAAELALLERRCRHRERLADGLPAIFGDLPGPGVRALFTGPSGTGKSLAARLLASVLDKDLHRLDLSGVVSKYLGETEKNLDRVFDTAAELDVVLLLDEGDVLLGRRTDVHSSHDRYANLETNYLLQRLESFDGVVVVTTNAAQQIDRAFERRLDVVVEFTAPGPAQRAELWRLHLPPDHAVGSGLLDELAGRCALTGGQVRNAVLHAALLALDGGPVGDAHVVAAVRREYRKTGAVCPLREQVLR